MSSSSISSSSSADDTNTFPSLAARMRRHHRNALSRQAESEWDAAPPPPPPTTQTPIFAAGWTWSTDNHNHNRPVPTTTIPPPPRSGDELICPLASAPSFSSSSPFSLALDASLPDQAHDADDENDDLQATLARFSFPPSPSRKHRRTGESIVHHHSTIPSLPHLSSAVGRSGGGGATRGCGTGPVKRARCTHCEHERTSV